MEHIVSMLELMYEIFRNKTKSHTSSFPFSTSRPALQLPGASKPVVVVRFCPVAFKLRGSNSGTYYVYSYHFSVSFMIEKQGLRDIYIFLESANFGDLKWYFDSCRR